SVSEAPSRSGWHCRPGWHCWLVQHCRSRTADAIVRRIEHDHPAGAVHKQPPAGMLEGDEVGHLADHGNTEAAGQDGGVALPSAMLEHYARQTVQIDGKQHQHGGLAGNKDEAVSPGAWAFLLAEVPEQAMEYILNVVDPLLEERRTDLLEGG